MEDSTKEHLKDLRLQYQQCVENYRLWDRFLWQVPTVTIAIASGIIGIAFSYLKHNLGASSAVLSFGVIFSFSLYVAVVKYRFFQNRTIKIMKNIETRLSLYPLPLITKEMKPEKWIQEQSAGNWLAGSVLWVTILLVLLLIYNARNFILYEMVPVILRAVGIG